LPFWSDKKMSEESWGRISCPRSTLSRILWLPKSQKQMLSNRVCCKIYCDSFWLKSFRLRLVKIAQIFCLSNVCGNIWGISTFHPVGVVTVESFTHFYENYKAQTPLNWSRNIRWLFILSCLVYASCFAQEGGKDLFA
jgi:hypothetical protein